MYIKSVIIEGFKSYGTRTEINGFDPEFNAITGLNGTGKSNILDSICFVLGISNLTHVRADRLQDLIYKSGQAGVTKASVTIVFDNTDTSKSPMNYEQYKEITVARQIAVAGRNRYLINGSTVTNKSVTDFFSSIQLNVNNPHFLIMQGRITKVLNMKPPEILSMIEEAAGTRMYENKKQGAQKTIEKKDGKLKDINDMVSEQINPKLERMKDERSMYIEYQKVQKELDLLTAVYVAWEYQNTETVLADLHKQKEKQKTDMENAKQLIDDGKLKSAAVDKDIMELQKLRDTECGGQLDALESELKEAEKVEAKISAKVKGQKDTISGEVRQQKQLDKNVKDDEKALVLKNSELSKVQNFFEKLREEEKQDAEALTAAQKRYQAVSSGLLQNDDGGEDATLQDQLMGVKKRLSELETEVKKCTMQIQHDKKELVSKKPLLKQTETTYVNDRRELEVKEKELQSLSSGLKRLNYAEGQLETLQEEMHTVSSEMRDCAETVNNYKYRLPQLSFEYQDPEPNFNHQKVRGLLCKLFTVKDPKFARAVETAAGGKLFSVVVDDERVSSKLIERGQLLRRTTFAPLNQIQGSSVDQNTFRRAQHEEGIENVFLAQSLIEYDRKYESIMAWAFGQTLICTNIDTAERISTGIRKRAVTLDGDVFDPSGIISGGAVDKNQPILLALIELMKAEKEFAAKQKHFNVLNEKLAQMGPIANNYEELKHKMCLREREVEMVRMRLQQTTHYQLQQELEKLQESIDSKEANIREWKIEIKEKTNRASEVENKLKNMKAVQEKAIVDAESELKRIKKKAQDSRNNWKQREQEFETLNLEIQELQNSVQTGKEQIMKSQELVAQLEDKLAEINEELSSCQENTKRLKDQVKSQKEEINKKNKDLKELAERKETILKLLNDTELRFKKCTLTIGNLESDIKDTNKILKNLKEKHKWIETDQQYFGQPNGRYDFEQYDPVEIKQKLSKLHETRDKLAKYVNAKSFDMLGNQEERVQDVMTKKTIIEEDRSKILSVIEELDVRKKEVIRRAWDKVNHDFHSILSSLLPSAQARLKPVDGYDFMHGLEVKVGFGGIWKESLDELSGGQRSLVALSLILAMLLFKPAPLYILDEVDAALDASHTQNIGQMLKAHFKQSQFLVVSLKDGMFNNANVLFRTAFVDGMSAVIRTVPGKK